MDILNPDIELIDGCHYRINPIDGYSFGKNVENLPYQEYSKCCLICLIKE